MKFTGTELKGTFSGKNFDGNGLSYLYIIVDGKASPYQRDLLEIRKEKQEYTIIQGLSNETHTVELVKVNEYWGMVEFHGFQTDGSEALTLPAKHNRFIEFYGDSNPSGWSAWNDKDQGGDKEAEGYYTYPAFVGRALEAEITNFSAGGHGITPKMGDLDLTRYFDHIHIKTDQAETNKWNHQDNYLGVVANVVVINLGANDYWSGAKKQQQIDGWKKMVNTQIRKVYPDAHIVLANSEGWAIDEPTTDFIDEMIEIFNSEGEDNISYVKFPWLWGQDHTVVPEHAGFAEILAEHISTVMDWNINNETADYKKYNCFPKGENLLGNPSFEGHILTRPDGWRAGSLKSTAKAHVDKANAKEGEVVVECYGDGGVHYAVKAEKDKQYRISVWVKGNGKAVINYAFRNQGQAVITREKVEFEASKQWQKVSFTTQKAPSHTWQININLDAQEGKIMQFDQILMQEESKVTNADKESIGFKVFPNPVNTELNIQIESKNKQYSIYNTLGQLKYTGAKEKLDVSSWEKACIFLECLINLKQRKLLKYREI